MLQHRLVKVIMILLAVGLGAQMSAAQSIRHESQLEQNKAAASRFAEMFNKQDMTMFDELIAPDFIDRPSNYNREEYRKLISMTFAAFPDLHFVIEQMVAETDKVALQFTWTGTHRGSYSGIAPSGKAVTVTGMGFLKFSGGKLVERWNITDAISLFSQLGYSLQPSNKQKK